jgi:molybdate transport system substrate-binding protein
MNRVALMMGASVGAVLLLVFLLVRNDQPDRAAGGSGERPIMLYCAASNRAVMESILSDYEAETGRSVEIQYGASQSLLTSMEVSGTGDLFLPADDSYMDIARDKI